MYKVSQKSMARDGEVIGTEGWGAYYCYFNKFTWYENAIYLCLCSLPNAILSPYQILFFTVKGSESSNSWLLKMLRIMTVGCSALKEDLDSGL